jgi:hypothetical protein
MMTGAGFLAISDMDDLRAQRAFPNTSVREAPEAFDGQADAPVGLLQLGVEAAHIVQELGRQAGLLDRP